MRNLRSCAEMQISLCSSSLSSLTTASRQGDVQEKRRGLRGAGASSLERAYFLAGEGGIVVCGTEPAGAPAGGREFRVGGPGGGCWLLRKSSNACRIWVCRAASLGCASWFS